jgi:hypothetical protein
MTIVISLLIAIAIAVALSMLALEHRKSGRFSFLRFGGTTVAFELDGPNLNGRP